MNMPVAAKDFGVLQGQPKPWRRLSPTGVEIASWFCGGCGGRVHGERAGRPEITIIRAGTLDDTKWLMPVAHMFMRSAQPWVQPAAAAICHDTGPDDFRPLAEAWRAMWLEFFPAK